MSAAGTIAEAAGSWPIAYVGELTVGLGFALIAGLLWTAWISWREEESRAARVSLGMAPVVALPFLVAGLVPFPGQVWVAGGLDLAVLAAAVILLVPWPGPPFPGDDRPGSRLDERTIMFSRDLYEPGTERYTAYYDEHPEHREADDRIRALPGLARAGSRYQDPVQFAAAGASFASVEALHAVVEGVPAGECFTPDPAEMTRFVTTWTHKLGAVSVGFCAMRDDHYYSTVGRGPHWGETVEREHRFGIALTVEMDKAMIDRAPAGPTLMESAQQYLEAGAIAVQLAELCRRLGWSARAHVDANYRVVCPLVARDAGLGEIGRMGLLMTPELGPRVRLAVVTTDLPLVPSPPRRDPTMLDFCRICRKCAEVCPAHAIPADDPRPIDGVRRWRLDQEACFTYWCQSGTDCARCVKVCPFSHPDNALHRLVRWGVGRNALFRRVALRMDDVFYGRRPRPLELQEWVRVGVDESGDHGH